MVAALWNTTLTPSCSIRLSSSAIPRFGCITSPHTGSSFCSKSGCCFRNLSKSCRTQKTGATSSKTSSIQSVFTPRARSSEIMLDIFLSRVMSSITLPLIFLSRYTFTVLPALSALRQTHACSKSNASTAKTMAFALSHPQDIRHSATLSSVKSQLKTFLFSEYFS